MRSNNASDRKRRCRRCGMTWREPNVPGARRDCPNCSD